MSSRFPPTRRLIQRLFRPSPFSPKQSPISEQPHFFRSSSPRCISNTTRPKSKLRSFHLPSFFLVAGAGILSIAVSLHQTSPAQAEAPVLHYDPDDRDPNLPRFRMSEVRKHDAKSAHPWVIKDDKVYDITEWVSAHPGGNVILRAAGGSIDPYWDIFAIHKTQYVYDILSQYLIGFVDTADLVDGKPAVDQIEDPFSAEPERNPALLVRTNKPMNAETPDDAVVAEFLTPNDLFYVRNHMWVPKIEDPDNYPLTVELTDGTIKEYTLKELKTKFKPFKVTAALQCSGNRRKHMSDGSGRKANGLPWNAGAISNACWEGVLLSDVLADAGFDLTSGLSGTSEAKHVQFMALEAYGASIPMKKAVDPQGDVILAYSMNGQPLPRDHGFPLRAIVPGNVAARSVKWLSQIILSDEESHTQWQRKDYKCFGPNQTTVDWAKAPSIQELPVQSAITGCKLGDWKRSESSDKDKTSEIEIPAQEVSLTGYAYSGGGRSIIRVDVSLDGGNSWTQAELLPDCVSKDGTPSPCLGHGSWAWRRWKYNGIVPLDAFEPAQQNGTQGDESDNAATQQKRAATFICKATDESYNTQPESHAATWNIRGNLATAWHRLKVVTECPDLEGVKSTGKH